MNTVRLSTQAFSGELTNWTQLGGADLPIRVFLRDPTSSTRQSFDEFVFPGRQPTYAPAAATLGSNAEMASAIHSFAGGIAMMTLKQGTVADPKIRLLSIDNVPATIAALNDGSYKIRRPLYRVYPVAAAGMKPDVKPSSTSCARPKVSGSSAASDPRTGQYEGPPNG